MGRHKKPAEEKPKNPRGRPTKFTPELEERILNALRLGLFRDQACSINNINRDSFYEWMNRYPEFSDKVEKAESDCEAKHLANITRHSETDPKQSQWVLSKRFYKRWGEKMDITSKDEAIQSPIIILPEKEIDND